ncbi:MAG: GNAT family N-acetyltransferase [Albidovulum sp.]|nr:GNAT family N-acetyltransferase [Albidovulum sp.]
MSADGLPDFELRLLKPGDRVDKFSSGDALFQPLKTFLKGESKKFQEQLLASTYVLADGDVVRAYVTLVCGEITAEKDINDLVEVEFRYEHYPAVKIARLAVDSKYRKLRFGQQIVDFAVGRALEIAEIAGCRFVVVDAKKPSVGFYEKYGFRLINTEENRGRNEPVMFLDLMRARGVKISPAGASEPPVDVDPR